MSQYACKPKKEIGKQFCIKKDLRCNKMINCPGLDDELCNENDNIDDVKDKLHPTPGKHFRFRSAEFCFLF